LTALRASKVNCGLCLASWAQDSFWELRM